MAKCKICGQSVRTAPVFHPACWQAKIEKIAAEFCDHYCMHTRRGLSEDGFDEHCDNCPMVQLLNLGA